ncbi:DNA repair protein rhp54 [Plakobranchus ocellatus]|uniref:DNA repair protein rhp54 n=1 Tax=Plakobranchus ocellatus TaxID=259542 RepID=A0AAV3Y5M7_9GAST|nr:DNA repair protein rhp54 [Plakobranchus ocellatus]
MSVCRAPGNIHAAAQDAPLPVPIREDRWLTEHHFLSFVMNEDKQVQRAVLCAMQKLDIELPPPKPPRTFIGSKSRESDGSFESGQSKQNKEGNSVMQQHSESLPVSPSSIKPASHSYLKANIYANKGSAKSSPCSLFGTINRHALESQTHCSEYQFNKDEELQEKEETCTVKVLADKFQLIQNQPVDKEDVTLLENWLKKIPSVPSQYCRKQAFYEGIKFIYPGKFLSQLHEDYVAACTSRRFVGIKFFSQIFKLLKLLICVPRKDQCDFCISAKLSYVCNELFEVYMARKALTQAKKGNKTDSGADTSVWTMDLPSVLSCPKAQASGLHYKTKSTVNTLTYFDLKTKHAYNYVFDKPQADLSSSMFASSHHSHFTVFGGQPTGEASNYLL